MGPLILPLEPLLAAMGAYVLGELGIETTKKMLKHASNADGARSTAASPTQLCPQKPDDDDPCKHLRKGDGPGKYRGGAHGEMKGPTGDGLESHHMPSRQSNAIGGGPDVNDGPAIQMEPEDHHNTMSYGSLSDARRFRAEQAELVRQKKLLEATDREIKDVRRVAAEAGDPTRYDEAIEEMKAYAECLQNEINRKN